MKKRILLGVLLVALLAGGVAAGLWYRGQTETKVVTGSATEEFVPADNPGEVERPKKVVRRLPWPMYGLDVARTRAAADFKHRPPFRRLWDVNTGFNLEFPPAVAEGRVFIANIRGLFLAVDAKTGKIAWKKDFDRCAAAGPAVAHGIVYMSLRNPGFPCPDVNRTRQPGFVIAMDAKTGRTIWRFSPGVVESSPLVVGDLVYFACWDHRVYAVNRLTGKVRWSTAIGEESNSSAAYAGGTIYIAGNEGHLFALDARSGKLRWRGSSFSRFGRREYFYTTPTVAYGRVFIGNADGTLYAYGAKTGRLRWARPVGSYIYSAAAVWNRRVYVGTYDGVFAAVDAATGRIVWRYSAPGAIHGAPVVMAGLVYFSTIGQRVGLRAKRAVKRGPRGIYALDARTGKLVWRWAGMGKYSPLVADERRVYFLGATRVIATRPKQKKRA